MTSNLFKYPDRIENECEVLDIYKKKFPEIIREYEKITQKTFCNPVEYQKIAQKKAEIFDRNLTSHIERFHKIKHNLPNLLKLDVEVHHNYALNFWLISYAFNEGPLVQYYLQLIENILKKLYSKKEEFLVAREMFLRTDYEIFYHKILVDSIEIANLLKEIPVVQDDLIRAKALSPELRGKIYDKIMTTLKKLKTKPAQKILDKWERHLKRENMIPIYNMLNQSLDNYAKNLKLKRDLKEVGENVEKILKLARRKLTKDESKRLTNLYFLVKEMLRAKDDTFGRKDLKLFAFWEPLTDKIVFLAQNELKVKLKEEEKIFLTIPWVLESILPKNLKILLERD